MKNEWKRWLSMRLSGLREAMRWTLREVADKLKMNLSTYSAYEEARCEPSLITLRKICALYAISVDQFFEGCPEATSFQEI